MFTEKKNYLFIKKKNFSFYYSGPDFFFNSVQYAVQEFQKIGLIFNHSRCVTKRKEEGSVLGINVYLNSLRKWRSVRKHIFVLLTGQITVYIFEPLWLLAEKKLS